MKKSSNRASKEILKAGVMQVVIKDLKNIMFWAKFGLENVRGGSAIPQTIEAIESYSEYLGYSETKRVRSGRWNKKGKKKEKKN